MQIVQKLAGYSLGRADLLRRAMSKKKQHVMEVERRNFIEGIPEEGIPGCEGNGIPADIAGRIYDSMMDFARYAFNKSHAACYAVVAMQTAWLKSRYPASFMAALMTSVIDNSPKLSGYIASCRAMGIRVLSPDINEGDASFVVVRSAQDGKEDIRYALTAIRGVGRSLIADLVKERTARGPFTSLDNFLRRMTESDLNRRAAENLIKAGALDSLGQTRLSLMQEIVPRLARVQQEAKDNVSGQISLFDLIPGGGQESPQPASETGSENKREYEKPQLLAYEKEVLGIYISGHPLESNTAFLKRRTNACAADFMQDEETEEPQVADQAQVTLGGILVGKKVKYTKNGQPMAICELEDLSGNVEVLVFPKCFEKYGSKLLEDSKLLISGRCSWEADAPAKLIADEIRLFSEVPRSLWIRFADREAYDAREAELDRILTEYAGENPGQDVCVVYLDRERRKKTLDTTRFRLDEELLSRISRDFESDNVKEV